MVSIVEVDTQKVTQHKISADSALMHPKTKVLALRAGNLLQIINLELKSKMKEHNFNNENVVFWKWISVKKVAIVTDKAVYHWSMDGNSTPQLVFKRHENLTNGLIMNYRTDSSEQWLLLNGFVKSGNDTVGGMQLYSIERDVTQYIEGHAGCFIDFKVKGTNVTLVAISSVTGQGGKLFIMEVPSKNATGLFARVNTPIQYALDDFPVSMQVNEKLAVLYIITRKGLLYLVDVETGQQLYVNRISQEAIFISAPHEATHGLIGINNKVGQVLCVSVDETKIVPYLNQNGLTELAIKIATRGDIQDSSISDLLLQQFNQLLNQQRFEDAVKLAAASPSGILRNLQTIQRLQRITTPVNNKPVISLYFTYIIDDGQLNKIESIELAKIVLAKGGIAYIKQLLDQKKIEPVEELGDMVRQFDQEIAMKIYIEGKCHEKIIDTLILSGDYKRVLAYCERVNYDPNAIDIFKKLSGVQPDSAVEFAIQMYQKGKIDPNVVTDIFVQGNKIRHATAFFLEILKNDKPEEGPYQTRLLEINLMYSPIQVTDQILGQDMFTYYDKKYIAQLCEKASLFHRALENYADIEDKKRVLNNAQYIDGEWLVNYLSTLEAPDELALLYHLMKLNARQNFNVVVQAATKGVEKIGADKLIQLFDSFKSYAGLFYFLGSIVDYSEDPEVHFKYIEASVRTEQWAEVERVTRKSDFYDPKRTKEFLKEMKLADLTPLINVCDKYDYIEELIKYLCSNNQFKYIDVFVKQRPLKVPQAIGTLLDVDSSEDYIKGLLQNVGPLCPIEPLVAEVEKRNRLKILLNWIEARVNEGSIEPAAHNALAKIYIDLHNNADKFLETNNYYDQKVVGKYCEKRDPNLAFIAYSKGKCDQELVDVTNKNNMFKQQARYLVKRQDIDLWKYVLNNENQYRKQLIDAVVHTALQETNDAEQVSTTVKAFMGADLPNELIELLEKIVLHGRTEFKNNKNLQNLLFLTAVKADKTKVMGYINRLDNYDGQDIAKIAVSSELFEEAFEIYKKFKLHTSAVRVLIENIQNIQRASEFAEQINDAEVWSLLGSAQLRSGLIPKAIESYLKANDPSLYHDVIEYSEQAGAYEELVPFLRMARKKIQDSHIDTELVYCFAMISKKNNGSLADLEEFISGSNMAKIQNVADRCFNEEVYEAARILYASINNYSCLASALIKLDRLREAVNAATKANTPKTWKEVFAACITTKDFKNAENCATNLIVDTDELEFVIQYYEQSGYFEHLIKLIEKGVGLNTTTPMPINTYLGIVYAKYLPNKLMEHITKNYKKINISKLLVTCKDNHLWAETRFLHSHNDEYDLAIQVMMNYPVESFDHLIFVENITKVMSTDLFYKSIKFYITEHPDKILDLLSTLAPKLDHEKVANDAKQYGYLSLIKKYLESVQDANLKVVNECLNGLYVEEDDYVKLRESITNYNQFNQLKLAEELKNHELLEFRRISTVLYQMNKQYGYAIDLSKGDKLYKDAIDTAYQSKDSKIAEDLLLFFVQNNLKECFAACLYTCYELIHPDIALEYAWRFNVQDMAMPYLIQVLREYTKKVDELTKKNKELEKQIQQQEVPNGDEEPQQFYDTNFQPGFDPSMFTSQSFGNPNFF